MFSSLIERLIADACVPDDTLAAQQVIVAWLAQHPDEQSKDADTAVSDANRALWPCGKN